MVKNNLFIKIYIGFLLTTVITITTMVLLDRLAGSGPTIDRLRHNVDNSLSFYSHESIRIFEEEGPQKLVDYLNRMERSSGVKSFLFDSEGKEVTGRHAAELKEFALSPDNDAQATLKLSEDLYLAAKKASGSRGAYVFAAKFPKASPGLPPPGPPPFGPPGGPSPGQPPGPPPPPPGPFALLGPPGPPSDWMPLHTVIRLALGLAISGLFCFLFARYMTSPVLKVGKAVRQFARGDMSVRVGPELGNRGDELARLAGDFDNMAERIESLLDSQRNLLRDVSHELRSPLARLNVALELCRKGDGAETGKYLERIAREADKLNEMIGQILAYNKMESRAAGLELEQVDLEELVREIAEDAQYEARSRNRDISFVTEPCTIEGDREVLHRAVENVVRNAIAYTAENSAVEITQKRSIEKEKGCAVVSVRDHGPGVPEEDLAKIFHPFYRVDQGRGKETGGTGLGLAITESAIRMHNGTVRADNSPDGGLVIEINLPLS